MPEKTVKLPLVGNVSTGTVWIAAIAGTGGLAYALWKKNQEAKTAAAAQTAAATAATQTASAYGYGASPTYYGYGGNAGYNYGYAAFNAGEEAADYYAYGYNAGETAAGSSGTTSNTGSTSTGSGQTSTTPARSVVTVPNVMGESAVTAQRTISAAGLKSTLSGPAFTAGKGTRIIEFMNPAAYSQVSSGTNVVLGYKIQK